MEKLIIPPKPSNSFEESGNRYTAYPLHCRRSTKFFNSSTFKPLPFDQHFDLKTNDSFYCTEWISKSLWKSAHLNIPVTNIDCLELGSAFIYPDEIWEEMENMRKMEDNKN